jgi:hypothetical protein
MAKPKDKKSLIADITNRYRVTAREARDIVTAVSTAARTVTDKNLSAGVSAVTKKGKEVGPRETRGEAQARSVRNIAKQVGEVYTAATKGKSGTKSAQIKSVKNKSGYTTNENYALETKRKQGSKK